MIENNSNLIQEEKTETHSGLTEPHEPDFIDQLGKEDQQALKKKIFKGIKSGIRMHEERARRKKKILHHAKIAASILLIIAVNVGLWQMIKIKEYNYQTGPNERLQIELPDGSTVLLNSNSTLTFSHTWALGFERKVELIGEAYFDIAKDSDAKRFVINEGEVMEVEVYGTEFNLKNQHPIHKLTLIKGSVKLGYQDGEGSTNRMVVPGETIKLNVDNNQLESKTLTDPVRLLAWQDRKLRMQNESLEEVLGIVTELYDLEIIDQKIPPTYQLISGSLPLTDNPHDVINNIEVLFDTEIHLKQNSIRVQ